MLSRYAFTVKVPITIWPSWLRCSCCRHSWNREAKEMSCTGRVKVIFNSWKSASPVSKEQRTWNKYCYLRVLLHPYQLAGKDRHSWLSPLMQVAYCVCWTKECTGLALSVWPLTVRLGKLDSMRNCNIVELYCAWCSIVAISITGVMGDQRKGYCFQAPFQNQSSPTTTLSAQPWALVRLFMISVAVTSVQHNVSATAKRTRDYHVFVPHSVS